MNEKIIKSLLVEIAEQEVPAGTDLWPEIRQQMRASELSRVGMATNRKWARIRLAAISGLAAALVFFIAFLFTPQGRAFAQQVAQFFDRIQGHTQPLPDGISQYSTIAPIHYLEIIPVDPQSASQIHTNLPTYPGCEDAAVTLTYRCQMAAAELMAGFNAKELASDPTGLAFQMVEVDPEDKSLTIGYTNGNPSNSDELIFSQGLGHFPADKFGQVPADEVEDVLVAGSPGEYVSGGFIYRLESDFASWLNDPGVGQQLAWQKGDHWFIISANITPGHPGYMDKQGLITLAESLVDAAPVSEQERLRPEYLHTLAEAETLAGFDLKAPSNLPDGFRFYQTQFAPRLSQVRLMYISAAGSWLEILEIPEEKFKLEKLVSGLPTAEKVEIKVNDGWYVNRDVPSSSPVFLEGGAHEALFWNEDGIVYQILFFPGSETGDQIGKTGMVAIASSLVFVRK